MPMFRYKAVAPTGETLTGQMEAASREDVVARLQDGGNLPIEAVEAGAAGGFSLEQFMRRPAMSETQIVMFTQQLSTLLGAGQPLDRALQMLSEQPDSEEGRRMVERIKDAVRGGTTLSSALEQQHGVFSRLYVNMVRAGEASGSLETVLLRIADFMDQQEELKGKVTSAMIYPIIMTVLSGGIVMMLMINVVPQITDMFDGMNAELPWNTKFLIWISNLLADYWFLFLAAGSGLVWLFRRWRATEIGRATFDTVVLKVPIVGDLARKLAIARFARTLATMLASGVQLLQALDIVRSLLGNYVLEKVVGTARDNIREGEGIAPALKRSGEFPTLVTHMIAVGERSGQLEQMLVDVANAYDREVNTALTRMTAMLEPLMIVAMGGSVGFIVFSIMQPIMMLNEMAGQQ